MTCKCTTTAGDPPVYNYGPTPAHQDPTAPIVTMYAAQFPEEDVQYWRDPPTTTFTTTCTEKDKYISHLEGEVEDLRETIQALLEAIKLLANSG